MKFLVIGLGSMGKRRVRCLKRLGYTDIIGFDTREDRTKETKEKYGIETFNDFEDVMKLNPDAFIVSTPPDLHTKYALIAAKNGKHFFTEASVVSDGMEELIELCKNRGIVAAPSCTARFYPQVKRVREILKGGKIGRPLAFTYHFGYYLPFWHPWENYKDFYASKKKTSAAREMTSFELVWLTYIFGGVEKVSCFKGKVSDLDVDVDDAYQIISKHGNNVLGNVLIDSICRFLSRSLRVLCEKGVLLWDLEKGIIVFGEDGKKMASYGEGYGEKKGDEYSKEMDERIREEPYMEELTAFIDAIKGLNKYPYSLEDDRKILKILETAEKSSENGNHENV